VLTGAYRKIIHVAGFISILAFVCFLNSTAFFPSAANNDGEQGNDKGADPVAPIVVELLPSSPSEELIPRDDSGADLQPAGAIPEAEAPLQEAPLPEAPLPEASLPEVPLPDAPVDSIELLKENSNQVNDKEKGDIPPVEGAEIDGIGGVGPVVEGSDPTVGEAATSAESLVVEGEAPADNSEKVNENNGDEKDKKNDKKSGLVVKQVKFMETEDCAGNQITNKQLIESSLNNEVFICGQVEDITLNTLIADSANYTITLYDSDVIAPDCVSDASACYRHEAGDNIFVIGCNNNNCGFSTKFSDVAFFANPSARWKTDVKVAEVSVPKETEAIDVPLQVDGLLAVEMPANVEFPNIEFGQISEEIKLTFVNTGNLPADIEQASSGDLVCDSGTIPADNVRYSLTSGFAYEDGVAFSVVAQLINVNLTKASDPSIPATVDLYLRIKIPLMGIGGKCSNVLTFNAVNDQ